MLIVACPGQGSQTPGFLSPWLELPSFATRIGEMSEAIGLDLARHGTESDADTIRDTAIAQPLIVAASIASALELKSGFAGVAGHSVGEVAAATIAGVFSLSDGIKLVKSRGDAMAEAAALEKTSMAAVLGGDEAVVLARLAELSLEPANYNGAGQIVAAGSAANIEKLATEGIEGARVIALQVAGAFHTSYMQSAVQKLEAFANGIVVNDPKIRLWSNQAGQLVTSGNEYRDLLIGQVANSVRWDLCMKAFTDASATAMIEVSPAGTLTGLARRAMPGVELLALKTPDQLDAANELISNHS
jgi:[acyl-carrier-protein] S-malonyltransferase